MFSCKVFRFQYLRCGGLLNAPPEILSDHWYQIAISPDITAKNYLFGFRAPRRKEKGGKTDRIFQLLYTLIFFIFDFVKMVVCRVLFVRGENIYIHKLSNKLVKGGGGCEILLTSEKEVISP